MLWYRGHRLALRALTLSAALVVGCSRAGGSPTAPPIRPSPPTPRPAPTPTSGTGYGYGRPTPTPTAAGDPHFSDDVTCSGSGPGPVGRPGLLLPRDGHVVRQDDPTIGCSRSPTHGRGFRIEFDWAPSCAGPGIEGYQLWLMQTTHAIFPAIDVFVPDSEYIETCCHCFVIERNRRDWRWRVRARDRAGNWSDWSEERSLEFAPCPRTICG